MTRFLLTLILISISSTALSTTLYRWVDDEGRVHFSDQPQQGAEEITVKSPSTFETQKAPPTRPRKETREKEVFTYASLNVTQPSSEQTLWNLEGVLNVSISLQPGLRPGHTLRANLNGSTTNVGRRNSFRLTDVYRGEQNLSVTVVNEAGREIIRSPTVKFFVQQTSIN